MPASAAREEVLLEVRNLTKHFPIRRGVVLAKQVGSVQAVDRVHFSLRKGETLGLVGESGCGKSTTGQLIMRLIEPTAGEILFEGRSILGLRRRDLRALRRDMQIVFQDPFESLDPKMTVEEIIGEPLEIHRVASGKAREVRVHELLDVVGLKPFHAKRFPHEFSGGQRQRIGLARALALHPKLVVCDEPVSALDVSIQAQVINLLKDLQKEFDLTYLFIAHDLSVVKHISDRVAVMYLGKIVELAEKKEIYANPVHPYTQALLSAIPIADPKIRRDRIILEGDVPSPIDPPPGCRFHTRCRRATEVCRREEPPLADLGGEHRVACHLQTARGAR